MVRSMLKKFETYIAQKPWDEVLLRQERWINKICWGIVLFSALYFLPICIWTIYEVNHNETQTRNCEEKAEAVQLPFDAAADKNSNLSNTTERRATQVHRLRRI